MSAMSRGSIVTEDAKGLTGDAKSSLGDARSSLDG